jgi:hypothetical protein
MPHRALFFFPAMPRHLLAVSATTVSVSFTRVLPAHWEGVLAFAVVGWRMKNRPAEWNEWGSWAPAERVPVGEKQYEAQNKKSRRHEQKKNQEWMSTAGRELCSEITHDELGFALRQGGNASDTGKEESKGEDGRWGHIILCAACQGYKNYSFRLKSFWAGPATTEL